MTKRLCPNCHSAALRHSRRRGIKESVLLPLFFLYPFRCRDCDRRFYRFSFARRRAERPARPAGVTSRAFDHLSRTPVLILVLLGVPALFMSALNFPRSQPASPARPEAQGPGGEGEGIFAATRARGVSASREGSLRRTPVPVELVPAAGRPLAQQTPLGALRPAGEVYVNDVQVSVEHTLFPGDTVRTGPDGSAGVSLPGRGVLLVAAQTRIAFVAAPRYFASLQQGTVGLRSVGEAANFQIQVGSFIVVPVAGAEAVAEIERAADGSARVRCDAGSVGVFALEGPESVFLRRGQALRITPQGTLTPVTAAAGAPAPSPAPAPAPAPKVIKKSRTGLIVAGVAGAGAAGAAVALAGRGGQQRQPMSPSVP